MNSPQSQPLIDKLYLRYLDDERSAAFIRAVSVTYLPSTLERLALRGQPLSRRAAVLALGFVGNSQSNAVLARAMKDQDEVVRMLAESSIREVWHRDGSEHDCRLLKNVIRFNMCYRFEDAVELATSLIAQSPRFAEVWNQRAIAHYRLRRFEEAANDCLQTLELNPYHFDASVGIAHCYLEMGEGFAALEYFRRAYDMNPEMDEVKGQIEFLQRSLEDG